MIIGVNGASGYVGAATVRELKARASGERIVGISRTPAAVVVADEARLGDYDQPETLRSAYAGLDSLFLIPSAELAPGKRAAQNKAAIDAAVAAGVKRVVVLSTAGARYIEEPNLLAFYYATEQHLMRTAPRWSILRMNYFSDTYAGEAKQAAARGVLTGLGEARVAYVARDDLAAAAAGLLLSDGHDGAVLNATGPASLNGAERAAAIAAASGKPVAFRIVSKGDYEVALRQAGLPDAIVKVVIDVQDSYVAGGFDIVTGDVERLSGKAPRSFENVLRAAFVESS